MQDILQYYIQGVTQFSVIPTLDGTFLFQSNLEVIWLEFLGGLILTHLKSK